MRRGKMAHLEATVGAHVAESIGVRANGHAPAQAAPAPSAAIAERDRDVAGDRSAKLIPLDRIEADPGQPRRHFDEAGLSGLASSLLEHGQLQPIAVRWDAARSAYIIVAGERRWRAATMAGLKALACRVLADGEDLDAVAIHQLVENLQREDLSPLEKARAFRALMARKGWSARELASVLKVSHSGVVQALAILRLPEEVRARVEAGEIAPTTAYEISKLDDADQQVELGLQTAVEGLKRAAVAARVAARREPPATGVVSGSPPAAPPAGAVDVAEVGSMTTDQLRVLRKLREAPDRYLDGRRLGCSPATLKALLKRELIGFTISSCDRAFLDREWFARDQPSAAPPALAVVSGSPLRDGDSGLTASPAPVSDRRTPQAPDADADADAWPAQLCDGSVLVFGDPAEVLDLLERALAEARARGFPPRSPARRRGKGGGRGA